MDAPVDNDDDNAQRLTTAQRVEIVRHYYHNDDNATRTAAVMSQLMNRVIQRQTVSKLIAKFERLGSVVDAPRSGRPVVATSDADVARVLSTMETTPKKSANRMALEEGMSQRVSCLRFINLVHFLSRFVAVYTKPATNRIARAWCKRCTRTTMTAVNKFAANLVCWDCTCVYKIHICVFFKNFANFVQNMS